MPELCFYFVKPRMSSTEDQIIEWGKAFRKDLPDPKIRKLFDQYIRYKSNPKSGIPEDKLLSKTDAIEEAIAYYSIKYEIAVPDKPHSGLSAMDKPQVKSKDETPEEEVDMDKFAITTAAGSGSSSATKEKKPRSRRKKSEETDSTSASKKEKAEPKPKPKRKAASVAAPPPPPEVKPPTNLVATFLEKEMETLQVEDVEIIHLKNFEYDGRNFYRDEKKGKIYQIGRSGAPGPYIGRWNYRTSMVETDIPDSDTDT